MAEKRDYNQNSKFLINCQGYTILMELKCPADEQAYRRIYVKGHVHTFMWNKTASGPNIYILGHFEK